MDTNRIVIINNDLSTATVEAQTDYCGFTVVNAEKGPCTPIRIAANNKAKIQDIFGLASKAHPDMYEVQDFNTEYDIYVSAPYGTTTQIPVAYVSKDGINESVGLINYSTKIEEYVLNEDIDNLSIADFIPVGAATVDVKNKNSKNDMSFISSTATENPWTTGVDCLKTLISFNKDLLKIKTATEDVSNEIIVNEITLKCVKQLVSGVYSYTWIREDAPDDYKTCKISSDYIYIYLKASEADKYKVPSNCENPEVYAKYNIDLEDIKGVLFPKYPSTRALHVSFDAFKSGIYDSQTVSGRNILKMTVYEDGAFHNASHPLYIVGSLNELAKDASGASLAFNEKNAGYNEQELIGVFSVNSEGFTDVTGFPAISQYNPITLKGGTRAAGSYENGWEKAQKSEYSVVNVFFDVEKHHEAPAVSTNAFFALASTHKLAGYIFNFTPEVINDSLPTLSYGPNYWNLCNEAIVALEDGTKIISTMVGPRTRMQCRIIENYYGGVAPMFLNSGNPSAGGQLDINPIKLRYRYNKDQQSILDDHNINPAILDHAYGVYITGQKTCKSGEVTDWSYIGHVSSFLEFERQVKEQVMAPQIGKANNEYYRSLRKQQVDNLLSKRISGTNRIWAAASCDTSTADGCNDIAARRARKFIINVRVKVEVFSETVELHFENVDQGTTI